MILELFRNFGNVISRHEAQTFKPEFWPGRDKDEEI